jgi:hypothetical protein
MMPSGIITKPLWIIVIVFALIVIGIAIASDVFEIKNTEEPANIISIGDIIDNTQQYIGKNITVRGYYYQGDLPEGEGYITSDGVELPIHDGSFENVDYLMINSSGVNTIFVDDTEYYVTGTLVPFETTPYPIKLVILSAEKVEPV